MSGADFELTIKLEDAAHVAQVAALAKMLTTDDKYPDLDELSLIHGLGAVLDGIRTHKFDLTTAGGMSQYGWWRLLARQLRETAQEIEVELEGEDEVEKFIKEREAGGDA